MTNRAALEKLRRPVSWTQGGPENKNNAMFNAGVDACIAALGDGPAPFEHVDLDELKLDVWHHLETMYPKCNKAYAASEIVDFIAKKYLRPAPPANARTGGGDETV